MKNPIQENTGSLIFFKLPVLLLLFFGIIVTAVIISKGGLVITFALIIIPLALLFLNRLFNNPQIGMFSLIFVGFTANGLVRYVGDYPFGLSIDFLLVLTYVALIFKEFYRKIDWGPAANDLTFLAAVWFLYALLQLINPEARSKQAWFYAMRAESLYMLLVVPLVFLLINKYKGLNYFLYLWAFLSILATLKGFIQLNIGLDPWEQRWMAAGGYSTHLLHGKLRVFSIFSDAGQFGAAQAHAGVVGTIAFLHAQKYKERVLFGIMAVTGFYGMFISGTRGAIAVPFAGFFLYLILTRNLKLITIGTFLGLVIFVFFKFTTIGNGVYAINRMRTAFNPNDPSLQLRLENQRNLRVYLANKPLGGGIGSSHYWGQKFTPGSYLSTVATDSWYVMIWVEQGVIGLTIHLLILFYILGRGAYVSMFHVRDPVLQGKLFAMASGILGIMAASYGNGVIGQIPTSVLTYSSMAFLFMVKRIDDEIYSLEEKPPKS